MVGIAHTKYYLRLGDPVFGGQSALSRNRSFLKEMNFCTGGHSVGAG